LSLRPRTASPTPSLWRARRPMWRSARSAHRCLELRGRRCISRARLMGDFETRVSPRSDPQRPRRQLRQFATQLPGPLGVKGQCRSSALRSTRPLRSLPPRPWRRSCPDLRRRLPRMLPTWLALR
jgi:hypothetical protein